MSLAAPSYKFLSQGTKGPFSGLAWPTPSGSAPGDWVRVRGPLLVGTRGVHVCRAPDLAHWLHDELWEVETRGEEIQGLDCVAVRQARLVRRIDSWGEGGAARFADACIGHAAMLAGSTASAAVAELLDDAKLAGSAGYIAVSAFTAALAVAKLSPIDEQKAFRAERARQSSWIVRELIDARR